MQTHDCLLHDGLFLYSSEDLIFTEKYYCLIHKSTQNSQMITQIESIFHEEINSEMPALPSC